MENFLSSANILHIPEAYIVCKLTKTKKGHNVSVDSSISYSRAREIFLAAMSKITDQPNLFGLHSLRSGGASTAANNDISDRLIGKHRR